MKSRRSTWVQIENVSEKKVLGVVDGLVKLIENHDGHKWEKGEPNKQGYFDLTIPSSQKVLTAVSHNSLAVEGK